MSETTKAVSASWPDRMNGTASVWRPAIALAVALAVLALELFIATQRPLAALPGYPAVVLAFVITIALPGLVLQQCLLHGRDVDPVTRLAVSPALGLAIAAVPGFIALQWHLGLDDFAVLYAAVAAITCGVGVLAARWDAQAEPQEPRGSKQRGVVLLALMLVVVLGGVATTPYWAKDRVSGDYDDWTYMAYVRNYLDDNHMNEHEPFLGTGDPVNPRMRTNVWVLSQALLSDEAGVPPHELLLEDLRPVLTICVVLATFALARTLFRSTTIALLAVLLQLGYALLDMAPHEGFGRNVFLRISEDKMVAAFMIFPIGMVFLSRYVAKPGAAAFIGLSLVALALAVVHPVPLIFLATVIVALGALRVYAGGRVQPAIAIAPLLLPVGLASIWPFIQRQLLASKVPEIFSSDPSAITFRDEYHVVQLGHGVVMGNYHMILHPLVLLALVLTPLVWLAGRRVLGNQVLVALAAGSLLVFFVPLAATPVAKVMTPAALWKVPWMIPAPLILAYLIREGWVRAEGALPPRTTASRLASRALLAVAPALSVVVVLSAALAVQEQYYHLDGGKFYDWTSETQFLPGTGRSIFRGGLDRAFASTWRVQPTEADLFAAMRDELFSDSVVLAEPVWLNHMIPGVLGDIHPVDFGGTAGAGQRREDSALFISGTLTPAQLEDVVNRNDVRYIVVTEVGAANAVVEQYYRAQMVRATGPYLIYLVPK